MAVLILISSLDGMAYVAVGIYAWVLLGGVIKAISKKELAQSDNRGNVKFFRG